MRNAVSIGAIGIMVGVAAIAQPTVATAAAESACTVAAPDPTRLDTTLTSDGAPAYERWLENPDVSAANLATQRAMEAQFGADTGKESAATLARRGLIGSTVDHNTRTVVVVVTPEYQSKVGALQSRIAAALPSTTNAAAFRSAVIVGCNSGAKLAAAVDLLHARAWHPDAAKASFGFTVDANDSRLHVSFDPAYAAAADAARAALGDVAVVALDGSSRRGRLDDGRPHFGGAGVRVNSGGLNTNTCSTAFTVRRNSNGQRGGVSAGHCFNNNQQIYSSTRFWGTSWGESNFPAFDMIGVAAAGETYDNTIHVDPCCPSTRNVTAKRQPAVNDSVCLSGMTTRATCGIVITNLFAELCDESGCTAGLLEGRRGNDTLTRGGDSGGPIYIRSGESNAIALGLIVGTTNGTNVVGEKLGNIESHLGVTILTS